ncbi:hypothetical protein ACP4OV_016635 [Aristida adscensionis]
MALFKSNTGVLLAFMAYMVICTAMLSCYSVGEEKLDKCNIDQSCDEYHCKMNCVNRGFKRSSGCITDGLGDTYCCCLG